MSVGIAGVTPLPGTVTHDPLGQAMTDAQRVRLNEQPSAPVEEAQAKSRLADRRREGRSGRDTQPGGDRDDKAPGGIIDSYA